MSTTTATTAAAEEIRRMLADLYDAFSTGDADPWAARLSVEHTPHGIGTDPQEFWSGRDQLTAVINAQISEMSAAGISFQGGSPLIDVRGDVAWIADQPTLRTGDGTAVPMRLTVVLTNEDDAWRMVSFHLSVGVPNETLLDATLTT
ncbi:MAG TPA: nuclear transport factor 2 family protein [Euzebya sp.]|nr:nuclear transport factor 2 family protein [Euzebya sp.]